jgi:hypothetical protein
MNRAEEVPEPLRVLKLIKKIALPYTYKYTKIGTRVCPLQFTT